MKCQNNWDQILQLSQTLIDKLSMDINKKFAELHKVKNTSSIHDTDFLLEPHDTMCGVDNFFAVPLNKRVL